MGNSIHIAESLKSLRLARGLTQQQLARETGISQQNLSRRETGTHIPNLAAFPISIYRAHFGKLSL